MAFGKGCLCSLHAGKVEVALLFSGNQAVYFHFRFGGHGVESAAGSGNGCGFDGSCFFNQGVFDLFDDGGHLWYIVNLAVQHGTGFVLPSVGGDNVQIFIIALLSNDADNAAGADVQGKNPLMLLDSFGRGCFNDIDGFYHFGAQFFYRLFNRFCFPRCTGGGLLGRSGFFR